MVKFAANLTMLFTELPFMDRFEAAHKAGFTHVEFLFPYAFEADEILEKLEKYNLKVVLFNMPPGDWEAGERGFAAIPGREEEFRASVDLGLHYARKLGCKQIHAMSGIKDPSSSYEKHVETFTDNFRYAADASEKDGITVLVEPLNPRNMPGYFVAHQREAAELIAKLGRPNVKLQFDTYHAQIVDGDLTTLIRDLAPVIGHIQIASVPDRNEPVDGEINYPYIFKLLDEVGYEGWIGCEYNPKGKTKDGLGWVEPYL
jgi:hydroxypyruvate isomerase